MDENRFKDLLKAAQSMVDTVQSGKEPKSKTTIISYDVKAIRGRTGLTQAQFSKVLGIGIRTLQEWEQGRKAPSGPSRALLNIAYFHPQELIDSHTKMDNMIELESNKKKASQVLVIGAIDDKKKRASLTPAIKKTQKKKRAQKVKS